MKLLTILSAVVVVALSAGAHEALVEVETGKIVVVKPDGSVWGRMETNGVHYVVKRIVDPEITWREKAKRDPNEHKVFPYAVYTNKIEKVGAVTITNQEILVESEYKVNPKAADSTPLAKDGPAFNKTLVVAPNGK